MKKIWLGLLLVGLVGCIGEAGMVKCDADYPIFNEWTAVDKISVWDSYIQIYQDGVEHSVSVERCVIRALKTPEDK